MNKCKRCDYKRDTNDSGYCESCVTAREREPVTLVRDGDFVSYGGAEWTVDGDSLYHLSQVNDHMKDGDVFVVPDGDTPIVFTLLLAWPVQVAGRRLDGLHTFTGEEFTRHALGDKSLELVDFGFIEEHAQ